MDLTLWDTEMVRKLAMELLAGSTFLVVTPDGRLLRTWELVMVAVLHPNMGMILCEDQSLHEYTSAMSNFRAHMKIKEDLPTSRRRINESSFQAALRLITEQLGLPEHAVNLHVGSTIAFDTEEKHDDLFPGLSTIVRSELVQVTITATDAELRKVI